MLNIKCGAKVKFKGHSPDGKYIEGTGVIEQGTEPLCTVMVDSMKVNGTDVTEHVNPDISYIVPVKDIYECN